MSRSNVPMHRRALVVAVAAALGWAPVAITPPAQAAAPATTQPGRTAVHAPGARAAVTVPSNVRFYQARTSLLGRHIWYRQVKDGHPVVNGWYVVHRWNDGNITTWDGRRNVSKLASTPTSVSPARAAHHVAVSDKSAATPVTSGPLMVLPSRGGRPAHLVWRVVTTDGTGVRASYVDASSARTLRVAQLAKQNDAESPQKAVTGTGRVFDPNPVAKLQDGSLRDENDSNEAVPKAGYTRLALRHLDRSHSLKGRWARIMNANRATSSTDSYLYHRTDPRFEQVNAYHAVDTQQSYLRSLRFDDVNAEAQRLKTNAFSDDNSYYDPVGDQISFGRGGVDDAEDVEVIWHEYGHAIQDDQVPGFGTSHDSGAIGEGFGDYSAVTMSQATAPQTKTTPGWCVMDWDATSYDSTTPHCLRSTNLQMSYPDDRWKDIHTAGQIWSGALWRMNRDLGRDKATRIIVEAQFNFTPSITMPEAARKTVKAATALYPNNPTIAATTRKAFESRQILTP